MDTPITTLTVYPQITSYTKANGAETTIRLPVFELPAGTLLFRGLQLPNPKKDEDPRLFVRDWLGYPSGERFCMTPTHNTFFYTSPFVPFGAHTVGEWFNAIMVYQTVKNLKVVCMIGPSKWSRGGKEIKDFDGTAPIQRCDKFDYTCITDASSKEAKKEKELKAWDNCIRPEFAQKEKVSGWMAIADYDSLDNFKEGLKGKDTTMGKYIIELESRLPGKGIDLLTSTYTDSSQHRGFPEVVLFPWSPHPGTENQYTEARTEEDAADAIAEMSDKFNYLPMACITERGVLEAFSGDFKAGDLPAYAMSAAPGKVTRAAIDKNLSNYIDMLQTKGVEIPGLGKSLLKFDRRTGFFVMDALLPLFGTRPYADMVVPMETPEQREEVLQYKIRYRTFDEKQFFKPDSLPSGTKLPRVFAFERPAELYKQYKELGLKFPASFIPLIYGATELYQLNQAKLKQSTNERGAEEALRRAAEARKKMEESLAILAKKKAEREAKKTGKPAAAETKEEGKPGAPESPAYSPSSPVAAKTFTGVLQTEIPIVRTMDEAIRLGREVIAQPNLGDYTKITGGLQARFPALPYNMDDNALTTTMKYIFEYLHQNCYMLCVVDGLPYLFKLEGGGMPDKVRGVLEKEIAEKGITDIDLENTRIMQCILKPYQQEASVAEEWLALVKSASEDGYKFPNGVFILNLSDSNMLRTDLNEPWVFFTKKLERMDKEFTRVLMLPIFSYSGQLGYDDIPLPTYDDLFTIARKEDAFPDIEKTLGGPVVTTWADKMPKVVFRGGTTGCGIRADTNMRLRVTSPEFLATLTHADMMDVGITTITKQYKMDVVHGLGKVDPATVKVVPPISMAEQSKYKYILHVDGNVFAYRFLKSMFTGSLLLRVRSPYFCWADAGLRGYDIKTNAMDSIYDFHYIVVKEDLSDLDEILTWCLANDGKCAQIAAQGFGVAQGLLQSNYLLDSLLHTLNYAKEVTLAGGGPPKKAPKTRKAKKSKRRQTRKQSIEKQNLVLATYEGGGIEPEMEEYVVSTMKNLWTKFLKKS